MTHALITGATDGNGTALAQAFARRGTDLILVARDPARLAAVRAALVDAYGVDVRVFAVDLGDPTAPAELCRGVDAAGLVVDVLVHGGAHGEAEGGGSMAAIQRSVGAVVALSHHFLPGMVARRSGGVMLCPAEASASGVQPIVEEFLLAFGETLRALLEGTGVRLMMPRVKARPARPTAEPAVAAQARNRRGLSQRERAALELCLAG